MRYGFLTFGALSNAGYIRARELGKALLDTGIEVAYIVSDLPENHGMLDSRSDVRFVQHGYSLRKFAERRRAIRELKLDYLEVFNDQNGLSWLTVRGLRGPKLVGMWDEASVFKSTLPLVKRLLILFWDRWFRKHVVARFTSTREHQRIWMKKYPEPIVYMPHACYLANHLDRPSPFNRPTVVYMGQFHACWDQDLFFEAFRLLKQQNIMPPLYLMGTGPDEDKWKRFVSKHGLQNITFAGYQTGESLYQHLRHAHVLLFPMRPTVLNKTRCPSKTLAYAQARRPIITNRVGEIAEMLGDNAIYVEPSPEGFARGIQEAIQKSHLPDVNYEIGLHTWSKRAEQLIRELCA
ncbi:MAG: glycosyltransferase [Kiritimatiellia bacterium]|jgi:glycosyltransferase involved in cell wall biosynthesis